MNEGLDDCTQYEGKDGFALVDKFQHEALRAEVERLRADSDKLVEIIEAASRDNERLEKQVQILQHERDQCVKNSVAHDSYAEKLEGMLRECRFQLQSLATKEAKELRDKINEL